MHDDVVRDLEQARARTLELTDLDEPTLVAQHDPLMSPLVWDLAHVGQQEELWLLRGGDPAPAGDAGARTSTRSTTRSSTARADRRRCRCCRRSRRAPTTTRSAAGCSTCSSAPPPRTCSPRAWSSSTRSSTTRPCSPRCSCGRDRRCCWSGSRCRRAGRSPGDRVLRGRRPVRARRRRGRPSRSRSTTSGPRTPSTSRPFWIGRVPVSNRQWREFIADGGYDRRDCGPPGLGAPDRGRARAAAVLDRRRHPAALRDRGGRAARRARPARLLLRGRGVRALGGRAAADRDRVGEGLRLGSRPTRARRAWPWGAQPPAAGPGQPRRRGAAAGPGRRLPGRRLGLRRRADDRRRLGVDLVGLRRRGPASPR